MLRTSWHRLHETRHTMLTSSCDTLSEHDYKLVSDLVYRHCGINLHEGKKDLVSARLSKCIRNSGYASPPEYLAHLQADASGLMFATMIDSISTNLTSFFREKKHFDYLKATFLPKLMSRKMAMPGAQRRLRAWSA